LYHGTLLVIYQLVERYVPWLIRSRLLTVPRVLLFFALTNVGWLMFQEQETSQLLRDLALRPGSDTVAQWSAASYFAALIAIYSVPLAIDTTLYMSGVYRRARDTLPWLAINALVLVLLIAGVGLFRAAESGEFIYFQF
jgi:uncharacterized membrane protein